LIPLDLRGVGDVVKLDNPGLPYFKGSGFISANGGHSQEYDVIRRN
jgi:hypothetical protein